MSNLVYYIHFTMISVLEILGKITGFLEGCGRTVASDILGKGTYIY